MPVIIISVQFLLLLLHGLRAQDTNPAWAEWAFPPPTDSTSPYPNSHSLEKSRGTLGGKWGADYFQENDLLIPHKKKLNNSTE